MNRKFFIASVFLGMLLFQTSAMAQDTGEKTQMNKFIAALMKKMTLEDKRGQLN